MHRLVIVHDNHCLHCEDWMRTPWHNAISRRPNQTATTMLLRLDSVSPKARQILHFLDLELESSYLKGKPMMSLPDRAQ